jgi:hypothetical protein
MLSAIDTTQTRIGVVVCVMVSMNDLHCEPHHFSSKSGCGEAAKRIGQRLYDD